MRQAHGCPSTVPGGAACGTRGCQELLGHGILKPQHPLAPARTPARPFARLLQPSSTTQTFMLQACRSPQRGEGASWHASSHVCPATYSYSCNGNVVLSTPHCARYTLPPGKQWSTSQTGAARIAAQASTKRRDTAWRATFNAATSTKSRRPRTSFSQAHPECRRLGSTRPPAAVCPRAGSPRAVCAM